MERIKVSGISVCTVSCPPKPSPLFKHCFLTKATSAAAAIPEGLEQMHALRCSGPERLGLREMAGLDWTRRELEPGSYWRRT